MTARDCYFDADGCYVCPELPEVAAVQGRTTVDAHIGWNAGAESIAELSGDVRVAWSLDEIPAGCIIGLKSGRDLAHEPMLIKHGFYVYSDAGVPYAALVENGRQIGIGEVYRPGEVLDIRRIAKSVTYRLAGAVLATRPALTLAPVVVGACLYAAGDTAPGPGS